MNYEEKFDEHREVIKNLKPKDIISPQKLLAMGKDGNFLQETIPGQSCSFIRSYMSSYLFVRGYIMKVAEKFGLNRIEATQKFLEIVRSSQCVNEWLIRDLAEAIGMNGDELLETKNIQLAAQEDIAKI
jgi:hypothetical protein